MTAYFETVKRLTDEQWERAVCRALSACRFFPTPAELLDLAGVRGIEEREAGLAFEHVVTARGYSAAGGAYWSRSSVEDRCGRAARAAFDACGGEEMFGRLLDRAPDRLKRTFTDAYRRAVQISPASGLPAHLEAQRRKHLAAANERKALPATAPPPRVEKEPEPEVAKLAPRRRKFYCGLLDLTEEQWAARREELLAEFRAKLGEGC